MFRIGEFSIIAQVSGRLLRYYDSIGLFGPEYTDPQTGYRYYSAQQLPRLNRILAARDLGFSLEQIARLLDQNLSAEELRGMFTLRKAQIERNVQEESARLRAVESRLRQIEDEAQPTAPEVLLKSVPAQPFLALREVLPGFEALRGLVGQVAAGVQAAGLKEVGPVALVIHSPAYDPQALDFEVGQLLTGTGPETLALSGARVLTRRVLPAQERVATTIHVGPTGELHRSYGQLAAWLEHGGHQVTGPGRQIMRQLPLEGPEAEAVVELQVPIRPITAPEPLTLT